MAQIDPQQIEQLAAALTRALEDQNRVMPTFGQSVGNAEKSITGGGVAMSLAANAASKLAKGFAETAGALYDGQKGMKAFDSAIDGAADALMVLTGALALLGGPVTLLAAGLTAAVAAGAKYVKATNEQSDKLYDAYQQMAKSGANASDGLQGLYSDVKRLGGGINDLGDFISIVNQSAGSFAQMSGSVAQGRKDFARLGKAMEPMRASFMNLGMSQKEQNEGMASYLRLQSRIGLTQGRTVDQLAESTKKYLIEQDALTRLTGMSRQEQENERNAARKRETFAAKIQELKSNGDEKSLEAAKALEDTYLVLNQHSKEMGEGFLDITSGNIQSEAAQKLYRATQGEAMVIQEKLSSGQITQAQALDQMRAAIKRTVDAQGSSLGKINQYGNVYGELSGQMSFVAAGAKGFEKSLAKITKQQGEMALFDDKELNEEVKRQTETRLAQVSSQQAMQDFVRKGVDPATKATGFLARMFEKVVSGFKQGDDIKKEMAAEKGLEAAGEKKDKAYEALMEAAAKVEDLAEEGSEADKKAAKEKLEAAKLAYKAASDEQKAAKEKLRLIQEGETKERKPDKLPVKVAPTLGESGAMVGGAGGEGDAGAIMAAAQESKTAKPSATPTRGRGAPPAPTPGKGTTAAPAAASESQRPTGKDTAGVTKEPNTAPPPKQAAQAATVSVAPGMSDDEIKKMIMKHEGVRYRPYQDSLGLWTVGVGHLIGDGKTLPPEWDREFSQEEVMALFDKDYAEHKAAAATKTPNFDKMTGAGKGAFTDLTFNMGPNWLSKFPNTKKAIEGENNQAIAMGLADSKWATQVGSRAATIIDLAKNSFPMAKDGGIFDSPVIAGEAGAEAVIPLKNGAVPVQLDSTPTFAGYNEYKGYNMGPMSTDLKALEQIAGKLGAYDSATKMITDPKVWKEILNSGMLMNYNIGVTELGTKSLPNIGLDIGDRIKEVIETKQTDVADAINTVKEEFKSAMTKMLETFKPAADTDIQIQMLQTLQDISRTNASAAGASEKMLRVAQN